MAKLLIVDDEKNIRATLATLFARRGYEVHAAESGPRALAAILDASTRTRVSTTVG